MMIVQVVVIIASAMTRRSATLISLLVVRRIPATWRRASRGPSALLKAVLILPISILATSVLLTCSAASVPCIPTSRLWEIVLLRLLLLLHHHRSGMRVHRHHRRIVHATS